MLAIKIIYKVYNESFTNDIEIDINLPYFLIFEREVLLKKFQFG